jgi:hypothetical protein
LSYEAETVIDDDDDPTAADRLHRMVYLSTAERDPGHEELKNLYELARRNNERDGITGLTAYHDYSYIQVLEGPRSKVEACFERIRDNALHHNFFVVSAEDVDERIFDSYSMAFVPVADDMPEAKQNFLDLRELKDSPKMQQAAADSVVANFIEAFIYSIRGL